MGGVMHKKAPGLINFVLEALKISLKTQVADKKSIGAETEISVPP
jgi:hypothetical protein